MKRTIQIILGDLLLLAVLLLSFSFIHHGFAWLKVKYINQNREGASASVSTAEEPAAADIAEPEQTEPVEQTVTEQETEEPEEPEVEPEPEVDNRTEWQIKFAEHFTDEVVQTENSYSSPNISITITTVQSTEEELAQGKRRVAYHVADIYIASIDCFRTWLANNKFEFYSTQSILEMDQDSEALLAMSGDFYSYQYSGMMVRNGVVYRSDYTSSDICVLYKDGRMETLGRYDYDKTELLESGEVWQLWNFGPELLTEDGEIPKNYNIGETVRYINPRSAVGYYEPGHYCFVVVDGRQSSWSEGVILPELSQIFYDLGCTAAYNLDGGGSAVMTFNDVQYSRQSNGADRDLGDILLIGEPMEGLLDENGGEN